MVTYFRKFIAILIPAVEKKTIQKFSVIWWTKYIFGKFFPKTYLKKRASALNKGLSYQKIFMYNTLFTNINIRVIYLLLELTTSNSKVSVSFFHLSQVTASNPNVIHSKWENTLLDGTWISTLNSHQVNPTMLSTYYIVNSRLKIQWNSLELPESQSYIILLKVWLEEHI